MPEHARTLGRSRRRRRALTAATLAVAGAWLALACVIAEPQSELPRIPIVRPLIVRGEVVPPAARVLSGFPAKVVVPVELVDPTSTIEWRAYLDFDTITGDGVLASGRSSFEPGAADAGVRVLEVQLPPPQDVERCHVLEFVVAYAFRGDFGSPASRLPDVRGGDSVAWIVSPGGDVAGCPVADAGAIFEEAGPVDAGEGGGG